MHLRFGPRAGAALIALGCALLSSGCAIDAVTVTNPSAVSPVATPSAPESAESDDPLQYARRSYWAGRITATTTCPTGEVVISGEDQNVHIAADCQRVVVKGSDTNVIAQRVGTLVVEEDADFGYILVTSADTIDINGDLVTVYWDHGNPGVTMAGNSTANPNPVKE
ncbi:MAG: hypothetical protein CVT62_09155 [Actinobacteria bacterium HGW-Actinobacteria-2]|nr:MAG: hypothetical protein CVT62_09155 [Actinobacteria bacterium HGW-Actinobacteria-2]